MTPNASPIPNDNEVCSVLSASRIDPDPRAAPAISLILGYYVTARQLQELKWSDIKSHTAVIRGPKGAPPRGINLTRLVARELIPVFQQRVRAPRPFGKSMPAAPTIAQLLNSVLVRAGLGKFTPDDFARWSLAQRESIRISVVTG